MRPSDKANPRLRLAGGGTIGSSRLVGDPHCLEVVLGNPILEDYLERLTGPLLSWISYQERRSFIAEVRTHLEQAIEAYEEAGFDTDRATLIAIEEYGDPEPLAYQFLDSWFEKRAPSAFSRRFGHANTIAFAYFAFAQFLYVVFLQIRVFLPSTTGYPILRLSPAEVREIFPEPLPYPEFTFQFAFLILYPLIAPMVAGYWTGLRIPVRAGRAVYQAMTPILLYSFILGALVLPNTEGLLYAIFQVAYWLPLGCLAAHLSSCWAGGCHRRPKAVAVATEQPLHPAGGKS